MCVKIILAALAVSAVSGRPQFVNTYPVFYQTQYLVNPEGIILVPTIGIPQPEALTALYVNPGSQHLPQSVGSRNAEIVPDTNKAPSQNNRRHLQTSTNQNSRVKDNASNQVNTYKDDSEQQQIRVGIPYNKNNTRQDNVTTTNTGIGQENNSQNTNRGHSTTDVAANTKTKEYIPVSNKNMTKNDERVHKTNIDMATDKETDKTNMERSNGGTDQNRNTVRENDNPSVYRSNNSGVDNGFAAKLNPPVVTPSRPKEKSTSTTTTEDSKDSEDRWVWGYDDVTGKDELVLSTPAVDDRGNFGGSGCPKNKTKYMGQCVEKD